MRTFVRFLSLRGKLTGLTMTVALVVFIAAFALLVSLQVFQFRQNLIDNTRALATLIGHHNVTALEFKDREASQSSLRSLETLPTIASAAILDLAGKPFATFTRDRKLPIAQPAVNSDGEYSFRGETFELQKEIEGTDGALGHVALTVDLKPFYQSLFFTLEIGACFLLASLTASYFLAKRLQGVIASPILTLVEISKTISRTKDYTIRAPELSNDEIGTLVDNLNEMLEQIRLRDEALNLNRLQLEEAVMRAEAASASKGAFVASMSHEIRTPLHGIQGALHVLKKGELVALANRYKASRHATVRRFAELHAEAVAAVFFTWKLKPTQKGVVGRTDQANLFGVTPEEEIRGALRLRIDYAIASERFAAAGHFLPRDKSVESDGPLYEASASGEPRDGECHLDLGQAAGRYHVHAVPLWTPTEELGPDGENAVAAVIRPINVGKARKKPSSATPIPLFD
jgi:signal transduction histidine kinase